ncbi:MAG: hypothetical protein Q4F29_03130 [Lachnospiraceae bacterium]|nr:hypothetical protein [Lachnospiraceae bacterium]
MKKRWITLLAAGLMTAAMSMTAFAGEWKLDQVGWWYQNDDGTYLKDGWSWVNGCCYYFTPEGYCLVNTTTPDGYTVDASGAWTVDGVVQTQAPAGTGVENAAAQTNQSAGSPVSVNGMSLTIPGGFVKDEVQSDETSAYFVKDANIIAVVAEAIPEVEQYGTLLEMLSEPILDETMKAIGTPTGKTTENYTSGAWYCYDFDSTAELGLPGRLCILARIKNARVEMVMFAGPDTNAYLNDVMNSLQ